MSDPRELLNAYFADLITASQAAHELFQSDQADSREGGEDITASLAERLKILIRGLPADALAAGVPLEYFRTRLRGRRSRYARADDVGAALRSLGWHRRRDWRSGAPSHAAKWYPPNSKERWS
jgi:hypothetical protein